MNILFLHILTPGGGNISGDFASMRHKNMTGAKQNNLYDEGMKGVKDF